MVQQCGQRGAGQQLVEAGVGAVVRPQRVVHREHDLRHNRRAHGDAQTDRHHQCPTGARCHGQQTQQQQWEHHVELLFDGQRPEVQKRAAVHVGCEVVGRVGQEVPVGRVQQRAARIVDEALSRQSRLDQDARCRDADDGHHSGRQQTTDPARVEGDERDPSGAPELVDDDAAHQESRQDEEDVDTDEPSDDVAQPGVKQHDEIDRDGP